MKEILKNEFHDFRKYNAIFFYDDKILIDVISNSPTIKFKEGIDILPIEINKVYLDKEILFVQISLLSIPDMDIFNSTYRISPAKTFLQETTDVAINYILRGIQWATWDARSKYCSICGQKLAEIYGAFEKRCNNCNNSFFPNLSPAVMVLIKRKNEVLLARSPHFREGMYSAIAGFIDIGETAEDAAHREVQEEVGLKISSLKYFGSQSWPFPSSFMISYTADYISGEIVMQPNEIEDARWFNINNLPELPSLPSISRQLINSITN
jgi:NAD+ diphosphatase